MTQPCLDHDSSVCVFAGRPTRPTPPPSRSSITLIFKIITVLIHYSSLCTHDSSCFAGGCDQADQTYIYSFKEQINWTAVVDGTSTITDLNPELLPLPATVHGCASGTVSQRSQCLRNPFAGASTITHCVAAVYINPCSA